MAVRHFWMVLVRNDLRSRYRRSLLGLGWSLLQPIAMTVVLCTVFAGAFGFSLREYAPYLLSGLTFWSFVSAAAISGCQCFYQGEAYIRQHRAPLAIYPLRTTLGAGYHFLVGMAVVVAAVAFSRASGSPAYGPVPALILIFVFGWSLAVCTGTINVLFHDTQHMLEIGLQIMFYATPIMYKPEILLRKHRAGSSTKTRFAVMLELLRRPLLDGRRCLTLERFARGL